MTWYYKKLNKQKNTHTCGKNMFNSSRNLERVITSGGGKEDDREGTHRHCGGSYILILILKLDGRFVGLINYMKIHIILI